MIFSRNSHSMENREGMAVLLLILTAAHNWTGNVQTHLGEMDRANNVSRAYLQTYGMDQKSHYTDEDMLDFFRFSAEEIMEIVSRMNFPEVRQAYNVQLSITFRSFFRSSNTTVTEKCLHTLPPP